MIEIYLLEQLNTFVSCGTLSEAAEKLHMTQPTLSRSMRKLEDYFGFPLFNRDKKRLSLNESGKLMAEYARKILDEELEMKKHVRNFHKSLQTLHIGSIAPGPLMVILPQGAAFYPDITITSTVDTEEAILRGLLSDEYGIAILTHPLEDEHFISKKYISEHLNLSVSAIHPAASKNSVSFAEMNGQNFLMFSQVGIVSGCRCRGNGPLIPGSERWTPGRSGRWSGRFRPAPSLRLRERQRKRRGAPLSYRERSFRLGVPGQQPGHLSLSQDLQRQEQQRGPSGRSLPAS